MSSTLTPEGCAARRDRLWQAQPEPCDVLVITAPESLVYLANYAPSPFVFNSVEAAAALVLWPDCSILIGDNLLQPFLERSCVDEVVDLDWYTGEKIRPAAADPARGGSRRAAFATVSPSARCRVAGPRLVGREPAVRPRSGDS